MELEALNLSLTQSEFATRYKKQLDKRIYTELELEELPGHPQRKNNKHGNWCTCERCQASMCVVGGEITNVKVIKTRAGEQMAFVDVVYDANQYSCTLFPTYVQAVRGTAEASDNILDRGLQGHLARSTADRGHGDG